MSEEALVESFIKSENSPNGKWFVEVPVGLTVQEKKDATPSVKHVDAVCITSKPSALPESYPEGPDFYLNVQEAEPHISKAEIFRRIRSSQHLSNETVSIVEAKTGESSFKAIGQLEAYKQLIEEDYGWSVEEQILLSKGRDEIIDSTCNKMGYRVVDVKTD
jgi:hypothetical protein